MSGFHYRFVIFLVLAAVSLAATPASAHPHVFVDARAEMVFDAEGRITAVRHVWQFDEAFTAFAIQGLDANRDGKLSDDELKPLAKVNVDSLKEYNFFTVLSVGRERQVFVPPKEYWLEFHGGRLTLFYTLPLKTPVAVTAKTTLEVFDPEYFVAFTFLKKKPITLTGAPAGCSAAYHPPRELDAQTMATLAAIPVDQHDLPPELVDAAAGLANLITVECPVAGGNVAAVNSNGAGSGGPVKSGEAGAVTPDRVPPKPSQTDEARAAALLTGELAAVEQRDAGSAAAEQSAGAAERADGTAAVAPAEDQGTLLPSDVAAGQGTAVANSETSPATADSALPTEGAGFGYGKLLALVLGVAAIGAGIFVFQRNVMRAR